MPSTVHCDSICRPQSRQSGGSVRHESLCLRHSSRGLCASKGSLALTFSKMFLHMVLKTLHIRHNVWLVLFRRRHRTISRGLMHVVDDEAAVCALDVHG